MKEEVLPFFIKDLGDSLKFKVQTTPLKIFFDEPSVIVCSESSVFKKNHGIYEIVTDKTNQNYTPDINKLFNSFVDYTDEFDIEVLIMTGIGRDGVDGATNLKSKGANIIAQDEKSCPVYGMPKAAVESGIVDKIKTLSEMKECFRRL
jgi:chemotaxis response regulator CheB